MKKLPAVAQVRISLNDGLTVLDLKPGNTVKLSELRQIIKNNGFVSKEVSAVAIGTPSADQKTFTIAGSSEQVSLSSPPRQSGDVWHLAIAPPDARR